MQTVLTQLSRLSPEPFDCIVHVGAGADASPDDYALLNPQHLVLIEADPEAQAALAERFKDCSNVSVVPALIGAAAGETTFHRYTLASLNAPLGLGRLRELYPRIEEIETISLQSRLLHDIVDKKLLGARNLLIFDVAGQEAAILRSMPADVLSRFNDLIAITAAQVWHEGAETAPPTLAVLKESHFELLRESGDDPAWPQFLLRHDSATAALKKELEHRARLLVAKATQIQQQSEQIKTLSAERDDLSARSTIRDTELAELITRHSSLATSQEALLAERDELATRHSSLVTECEALRSDHSSLSTLHSSLVTERDDLVTRHTSLVTSQEALLAERDALAEHVSSLESENSDLVTRHSSLVTSHDALVAERDALSARVASLESENSDLVTRHTSLVTSQEALVTERDDLATRHQQLATALEELQGQHSSLVAERDALVTESEALRSDLTAKTTLLEVLTKGRIAQDGQMEKLLQEQKTLISERDVLASRVAALTAQVEKLEAHAKLIDEEFGKAEGQIELIKDIFLREAIR